MASSDPESVELKEQHVYGYVGWVKMARVSGVRWHHTANC